MTTARKLDEPTTSKQRPKRDKRYQYTIEERTRAITIVKMLGGLTNAALDEVDRVLGRHVNKTTIWAWMKQTGDLIVSEPYQPDITPVITDTRNQVITHMQSSLLKMQVRADDDSVIATASLKDLHLSSAIVIDKLKQFAGLSPELEHKVSQLQQACNRANVDILALLDDLINQVETAPPSNKPVGEDGDIVGRV